MKYVSARSVAAIWKNKNLTKEGVMVDGLYRVMTRYCVAGFVIEGGKLIHCAPILRKKIDYFKTIAVRISD